VRRLAGIELSFHPCNILRDSCRGVSRGNKNMGCGTWKLKTAIFCTCSSNNWETVEDRWVHGARGLASTELSFHSCNVLRDCHRGVPRANKKWRPGYVKMVIFCNCGSNNWETVVDRRVHTARRFYRAMLCKRGLCCHAVSVCSSVCLSVCPSVTFVDNVKNILEIFSPSGSHTILVWQNVLQYLNNFTKQHRAVCQR